MLSRRAFFKLLSTLAAFFDRSVPSLAVTEIEGPAQRVPPGLAVPFLVAPDPPRVYLPLIRGE